MPGSWIESTVKMINDHNLTVDSLKEVNENLRRQTVNKRMSKHMIRLLENTGAEKSNYMYLKQQKDGISIHGQLTQKPSKTKIHGQNKNVKKKYIYKNMHQDKSCLYMEGVATPMRPRYKSYYTGLPKQA